MKFFTMQKNAHSDYKNLLDIFAEMQFQSFSELSESQKKEIVGAWLEEDENEDEVVNILLDIKKSGVLSELMYGSVSSRGLGDYVSEKLIKGDVAKSISLDMDEAFGDYLMSLDNYQSNEEELRIAYDKQRAIGLNKFDHQRMGI